jgi:multiple sugar transport system permease protein/raffinose/stachyose/melibiose transport system permease protein
VTLPYVRDGPTASDPAGRSAGGVAASVARRARSRFSLLTRRDKIVLGVMVGVPTVIHVFFIWVPTILSAILSFTNWNGIGLDQIVFVGTKNYEDLFTGVYPAFWPALQHNLIWLVVFTFIATPNGIFFAVLLDKEIRGTRIYQSALYLPVVLSLAIVGFIWQLIYSPDQGLINSVLGTAKSPEAVDWLGDRSLNLWMILIAASWRHIGYIMVLYLAGLKSFDPNLRGASIDGASESADVLPGDPPGPPADQPRGDRHHRSSRSGRSTSSSSRTAGLKRPQATVGPGDRTTSSARPAGSGSDPRSR